MTSDPEALPETSSSELAELERKRLARDDGRRDGERAYVRESMCAKRVPDVGGFCTIFDGHDGPCYTAFPERYGPAIPRADRRLADAEYRDELAAKYDTKVRAKDWVDWRGRTVRGPSTPAQWWEICAMMIR